MLYSCTPMATVGVKGLIPDVALAGNIQVYHRLPVVCRHKILIGNINFTKNQRNVLIYSVSVLYEGSTFKKFVAYSLT